MLPVRVRVPIHEKRSLAGSKVRCISSIEAASLSKLIDPGVIGIDFGWCGSGRQRAPWTGRLRKRWLPRLDMPIIAPGGLTRNQLDPGSKMPSVFELGSVADRRNDRGGRLGADALDGGDAPTWLIFEEYRTKQSHFETWLLSRNDRVCIDVAPPACQQGRKSLRLMQIWGPSILVKNDKEGCQADT
jgi:hypothetical protein